MEKKTQMKEKQRIISIRMKLLAIIVPIVILLMVAMVLVAYNTSAEIIENYSKNLLESSVKKPVFSYRRMAEREY